MSFKIKGTEINALTAKARGAEMWQTVFFNVASPAGSTCLDKAFCNKPEFHGVLCGKYQVQANKLIQYNFNST